MDRVILHSDLDCFYASVECLHNPLLRSKPVAVCGDAELRHGIVLAKNQIAKGFGVKTGDVIWEAKQKCKDLVIVEANFNQYIRFSKMARKIYERYTNQIETFGIDECWLDVTGSVGAFGSGEKIANEIREVIKFELGCTASVGVSWNKIFAKLGSDMKKPDATTVITKSNYKDKIHNLPAEDLLYVGRATKAKLQKLGIKTIGGIAKSDVEFLKRYLGKWGEYLWTFANGLDMSPVAFSDEKSVVKSIGNSTTTVRDLTCLDDILMIVTVLAESVAARLREQWLKGQVVSISLTDSKMVGWAKQKKIVEPTFNSAYIIDVAMNLCKKNYSFQNPIRNIGVKVSDLSSADAPHQVNLFLDEEKRKRAESLEYTLDSVRRRFGHNAIRRATLHLDPTLTNLNPKQEHTIHPYSYFK